MGARTSRATPALGVAGLTGRTRRYGLHLEEQCRATLLADIAHTPHDLADWGALGGIVGSPAGGIAGRR